MSCCLDGVYWVDAFDDLWRSHIFIAEDTIGCFQQFDLLLVLILHSFRLMDMLLLGL
jgi:hypothetical protein